MHPFARPRRSLAASALALALIAGACSSGSSHQTGTNKPSATKPSATTISSSDAASRQTALGSSMRKLWEDHVTWTRLFIIAAEAGSPDADATAKRLLQNQTDIGDAIKPLYGDAAGTQLTALLRTHILTAGEAVDHLKGNFAADVADYDKVHVQILGMADMLTAGIVAQFPSQFS